MKKENGLLLKALSYPEKKMKRGIDNPSLPHSWEKELSRAFAGQLPGITDPEKERTPHQ